MKKDFRPSRALPPPKAKRARMPQDRRKADFRPSSVYYPDTNKMLADEEGAGAVVFHGNMRYLFFFGNYGRGEWTIKVDGSVFCDVDGEEAYL